MAFITAVHKIIVDIQFRITNNPYVETLITLTLIYPLIVFNPEGSELTAHLACRCCSGRNR